MARQSQPTILLTRPLAQSQRFAAMVGGAVIAPLMVPEFLSPPLPTRDFAAVVLTSETGVEAARRISAAGAPLPKRAFCVGDRTAKAAQAALAGSGLVVALIAMLAGIGQPAAQVALRSFAAALALRDALGFPQWYGCNWDAFWDAISGLVDMPLQLRIRGWDSLSQRLPDDARLLEQCLLRLQSQYPAWAADLQFD